MGKRYTPGVSNDVLPHFTETLEIFLVCNFHGDAQDQKKIINNYHPKRILIGSVLSEKFLQHITNLKQSFWGENASLNLLFNSKWLL